jgi:hypothetical protein
MPLWSWDFGDGETSNLQHPTHVYSTAGSFTVALTASNGFAADTEMKGFHPGPRARTRIGRERPHGVRQLSLGSCEQAERCSA